jgi:hypothetical protein
MRQALPNNLLHNPFYNRFNDPVTQRRDEMQTYENMVWLRERNEGTQTNSKAVTSSTTVDKQTTSISNASQLSRCGRVFAGVFALLLVLLFSVSVLKAF